MLRRTKEFARQALIPVAFASMFPLYATAHALPSKTKLDPKLMLIEKEKENGSQLEIYALMRASAGKMIHEMLCQKMFISLKRLSDNIGRNRKAKKPDTRISQEIEILKSGRNLNKQSKKEMAIASLFQNSSFLSSLYKSNKSLVSNYLNTITSLGFQGTGFVEQWLKNGKGDITAFHKGLFQSCGPLQR